MLVLVKDLVRVDHHGIDTRNVQDLFFKSCFSLEKMDGGTMLGCDRLEI